MRAADNAEAAIIAFVGVGAPRGQRAGDDIAADHCALRCTQCRGVEFERAQMNLPAMIGTIEREQPRLEPDERSGMGCAYCATHYAASIGFQPGGHVDRKYRRAPRI